MNKGLRNFFLKPLARRRQNASEPGQLITALERLDHRCLGEDLILQLQDVISEARNDDQATRAWKDRASTDRYLALTRALYDARRISTQEYVLLAAMPIEHIHGDRVTEGVYDEALNPITTAMDQIRAAHGLGEDEFWLIGEAPKEYAQLERQYSSVLSAYFAETLREFGLDDLAEIYRNDNREFKRLRERGRRSTFHRSEPSLALRDIVVRYEEDARRAASAKAYSAAVTLLGAGVEGLLLIRCLHSKHKAKRVAQKLPDRKRPRSPEDPTQWTFDNLIEVCLAAGWLPPVETQVAVYDSAGLAHLLRVMRNNVHPGKRVRETPWIETDERDYGDAASIYTILLSTLGHIRPRRAKSSSAEIVSSRSASAMDPRSASSSSDER